jgi:hypothetical protein
MIFDGGHGCGWSVGRVDKRAEMNGRPRNADGKRSHRNIAGGRRFPWPARGFIWQGLSSPLCSFRLVGATGKRRLYVVVIIRRQGHFARVHLYAGQPLGSTPRAATSKMVGWRVGGPRGKKPGGRYSSVPSPFSPPGIVAVHRSFAKGLRWYDHKSGSDAARRSRPKDKGKQAIAIQLDAAR